MCLYVHMCKYISSIDARIRSERLNQSFGYFSLSLSQSFFLSFFLYISLCSSVLLSSYLLLSFFFFSFCRERKVGNWNGERMCDAFAVCFENQSSCLCLHAREDEEVYEREERKIERREREKCEEEEAYLGGSLDIQRRRTWEPSPPSSASPANLYEKDLHPTASNNTTHRERKNQRQMNN